MLHTLVCYGLCHSASEFNLRLWQIIKDYSVVFVKYNLIYYTIFLLCFFFFYAIVLCLYITSCAKIFFYKIKCIRTFINSYKDAVKTLFEKLNLIKGFNKYIYVNTYLHKTRIFFIYII